MQRLAGGIPRMQNGRRVEPDVICYGVLVQKVYKNISSQTHPLTADPKVGYRGVMDSGRPLNAPLRCLVNRSFELCPQLGGCRPFPRSESAIKRIRILVAKQVRHLCDIDIRPVEILAR